MFWSYERDGLLHSTSYCWKRSVHCHGWLTDFGRTPLYYFLVLVFVLLPSVVEMHTSPHLHGQICIFKNFSVAAVQPILRGILMAKCYPDPLDI